MTEKDTAIILFKNGVSQKDIAQILKVSEKTISTWAKKENWDAKKTSEALRIQTSEEGVQEIISYQLSVLKKIKDLYENQIEKTDSIKDLKSMLIERGDIDALQKLFSTIKGKQHDYANIVKTIRSFIEFIETDDLVLAKKVSPIANQFLSEKSKEL